MGCVGVTGCHAICDAITNVAGQEMPSCVRRTGPRAVSEVVCCGVGCFLFDEDISVSGVACSAASAKLMPDSVWSRLSWDKKRVSDGHSWVIVCP